MAYMKTDLQKYEDFFDEMGIGYTITKHENEMISMDIDREHIYYFYNNSLCIRFDDEENFVEFQAWGE